VHEAKQALVKAVGRALFAITAEDAQAGSLTAATRYGVNFPDNRCSGSPLLAGIEVEPSARELPLKQRS
jgi:hypothetical protein